MVTYNYVSEPEVVGDESTSPALAVGYPVEHNPVLLWKYFDRAGGGDEYEVITELSDDTVDNLVDTLETFQDVSPQYRDNE